MSVPPKSSLQDLNLKQKAISLKEMSTMVLLFIRQIKETTFVDVSNFILKRSGIKDEKGEKTLRRRVYDVLNVLIAAGIVKKEGKILSFESRGIPIPVLNPPQPNQERESVSTSIDENRIKRKKNHLIDHTNLLILNKLLIQKNKNRSRPFVVASLPAMFVGFKDVEHAKRNGLLNGTKIEISSNAMPSFFSPKDVLEAMDFSIDEKRKIFQLYPQLKPIESYLFPNSP